MKIFNLLLRRQRHIPVTEDQLMPKTKRFYTFDFDPESNQFLALFCHGTSSASVARILEEGIREPRLDQVVDEVLRDRADLLAHREEMERIVNRSQLSMRVRKMETGVFATWLANTWALNDMSDDMPKIIRHGGEVYAVAWRALSEAFERERLGELRPRFPDAAISAIFFQAPFYPGMADEGMFATHNRTLMEYSRNPTADHLKWETYPREVRFMNELPASQILWSGSLREAREILDRQLFSPSARKALGIEQEVADDDDDIAD